MKLKSISEILTRLIDLTLINTNKLNDFSVGSTILSIYESVSMELEQYYVLSRENILWGIEQGIYESFGFARRPERKAYGDITLEFHTTVQSAIYLARGSTFYSSLTGYNQQYETLDDYMIQPGVTEVTIRVYCTESGTAGNVPRGVVNAMMNNISNIKAIYNGTEFLTGTVEESLDEVKKRFQTFIDTRGRATNKAIQYGAYEVEDVAGVYVHEEVGYIQVYVHDLNGDLPGYMQEEIKTAIEDYRPAGIKLDVVPVIKRTIDLDILVTLSDKRKLTEVFQSEIVEVITHYLNSKTASDDLVLSDVIQLVMNIDDNTIYDSKITNLSENVIVEPNELIRSGTITVTLD